MPVIGLVHLLAHEREYHQGSHVSLAPMFAAALLLPPLLAAVAIAAAFLPDGSGPGSPGTSSSSTSRRRSAPRSPPARSSTRSRTGPGTWVAGALAGIATYLALQYGVLAVVLRLARGVPARDTLRLDCVLIDAGLLSIGAFGAALADEHAGMLALLALPLALMYRRLARAADASRGVADRGRRPVSSTPATSARRSSTSSTRAERFDRAIALAMVDVDDLRQINNDLGHVVGDRALRLVAATLRIETRDYDVAARFGGDEFCRPPAGDGPRLGRGVAERIRAGVEHAGKAHGLDLTVSIGVGVPVARGRPRTSCSHSPTAPPTGQVERP